jgi:hypothetical protein
MLKKENTHRIEPINFAIKLICETKLGKRENDLELGIGVCSKGSKRLIS